MSFSIKVWSQMLQSEPMCAPGKTWAKAQMRVCSPMEEDSTTASGCRKKLIRQGSKRKLSTWAVARYTGSPRPMKTPPSPWLEKFGGLLNRKPGVVIAVYTLIYFALTIPAAALKPFWYDELFTRVIAARSSIAELLRTLRLGWDLQPPLYYLLVRASHTLAGSELGLRMPSVIGLWLGSL